jgi:xanthine/CO dehydrogenase XdhC/CoxF family maturation factor
LQHLNLLDADVYAPLFVPAGLEIGAKNPEEIALSIAAEVIKRGSFSHES